MKQQVRRRILIGIFSIGCLSVYCQNQPDFPLQTVPLNDLSQFKAQDGNWQVVGGVVMDRSVDAHHEEAKGKKPEKNRKMAVTSTPGTGILLNMNDEKRKSQLTTTWEHGDIDLEFEVMLPKGSNSGVYLQGRYEVQLLDSWGVKNPAYSDIGGIYRNWEKEPGKIYMGKAPTSNPAKAPGLWQTMRISFQAPRFDAAGNKTANARFIYIELNGIRIHDNAEVPLPTGGPVENNEKPTGPIMIQGDHGPVAFRNIRYRTFAQDKVTLNDLKYDSYEGKFAKADDVAAAKPVSSGKASALNWEAARREDAFAVRLTGTMRVPADGAYLFSMNMSGGGALSIDNKKIISQDGNVNSWDAKTGKADLKAGTHDFSVVYFKDVAWQTPALGLFVEGANLRRQPLHSMESFANDGNNSPPILIAVGGAPKLLRAFIDFKGDRSQRRTHTIGVGDPAGISYVYDLKTGGVVCVWRGGFVDATPMWNDRGDGSFRPLGNAQYLFTDQPLAVLGSTSAPFPAEYKEGEFRGRGYKLDASGRPVFRYTYNGMDVEDQLVPDEDSRIFTREVKVNTTQKPANLYFKLAEGKDVVLMPDGSYAVDDRQIYIKMLSAAKPFIRDGNGRKELVVPVENNTVKYSIVW